MKFEKVSNTWIVLQDCEQKHEKMYKSNRKYWDSFEINKHEKLTHY